MYNSRISIDFAWEDYLALADELSNASNSEAKLRSSISRAYYASYCSARDYMVSNDHKDIPDNESKHVFVMRYFGGYVRGSKRTHKRSKISILLDRMRIRRGYADYENRYPVGNLILLQSNAKQTISDSNKVISILKSGGV
jgi:uncharacterized protein (UPF0332 family)